MEYNYTNLINQIEKLNKDNEKLKEIESNLINERYKSKKEELWNSGILQDWNQLNDIANMAGIKLKYDGLERINGKFNVECKYYFYGDSVKFMYLNTSKSHPLTDVLYIYPSKSIKAEEVYANAEGRYGCSIEKSISSFQVILNEYEYIRQCFLKQINERLNELSQKNSDKINEIQKLTKND